MKNSLRAQQRATVLAVLGFLGGLLALVSLLSYGLFEWKWWVELNRDNEMPRGLIIFLLHVGLLGAGIVSTIYLLVEWVHGD